MFYNFQGLGALPQLPPPVPGMTWVRYTNDKAATSQWTTCPPFPPNGCSMYGGYAWGQKVGSPSDEFSFVYIAPSTAPTSTVLAPVVVQDYCKQKFAEYATAYPDKVKCLNDTQKAQFLAWCNQAHTGKITLQDYFNKRDALVLRACAEAGCKLQMQLWRKQNPNLDRCLSDADRKDMRGWCVQSIVGTMSESSYQNHWKNRIALRCAAYAKKHPAPVAVKPPTATTPAGGGGSAPTPGDVLPSGGDVHDETGGEPAPSALRQWGPVVGIGLLLALAATVASQKKKKRKARR